MFWSRLFTAAAALFVAGAARAEPARAVPPDLAQIESAIAKIAAARGMSVDELPFRAVAVEACFPVQEGEAGDWICMLRAEPKSGGEARTDPIVLQADGDGWSMLDVHPHPACAPLETVQAAFRAQRGDPELVVRDFAGGDGGVFTTDRGRSGDQTGPLRLMCAYEVTTGSGLDMLFAAYLWHDGQDYVVDSDVETWLD